MRAFLKDQAATNKQLTSMAVAQPMVMMMMMMTVMESPEAWYLA
jgi:hypothetical protein